MAISQHAIKFPTFVLFYIFTFVLFTLKDVSYTFFKGINNKRFICYIFLFLSFTSNQVRFLIAVLTVLVLMLICFMSRLKPKYKFYNTIAQPRQRGFTTETFHIVQNFLVYTDPNFTESVKRTREQSEARQKELDDTLKANLNHSSIAAIHIMYTNKGLLDHLDKLKLRHHRKLILKYFNKVPTISMFLTYIETSLQNEFVIVSNQDVEYGENWDQINLQKFKHQKLMYALTRNVKKKHLQDAKCYAKHSTKCNPGSRDVGSYDLFAFYVQGKVPKAMIEEMDYTQAKWGMENVFVWYAQNKWGYHVMNPCKVLKVYHIDCHHISIKNRNRQQTGHIGTVPFTDKLYQE